MALRTKTIEYAFPANTASVLTAVARAFTTITVSIPENTSRVFRSVIVDYTVSDNGLATPVSLTAVNLSIQINAVAASAATVTQTITGSGENMHYRFTKDVTAYFQTNFTGTSNTVTAAMTCTGPTTQNGYAKIIITYEYDDSSATTRSRTVKIPVDGNTGNATTGLVNVGAVATQIPALDTFLPESSKVYRSIFFEILTHTGTTAAAATTVTVNYNGTSVANLSYASGSNVDSSYHRIDDITAIVNTAAVNALQVSVGSTTGGPQPCFNGVLVVTYEFDHSASTRIMNSIQIPIMDESGLSGATVTGDKSRFERTITVQEPGTITLVQSGIMASYAGSAAMTVDFRIGGQASRTFAHAASLRNGTVTHMRRFDSGAVGGAGMTLARGSNSLVVDWFSTAGTLGTVPSNMSGICYLNYTSDKHTDGDAAHSHTVIWCVTPYSTGFLGTSGNKVQVTASTTPNIISTNYWLTGAGFQLIAMGSGASITNAAFAFLGEVQATESEGAGWRPLYNGMQESDTELGSPYTMFARSRDDMKRWPADPDSNRLLIENARSYRYDNNSIVSTSVGWIWQTHMYTTWYTITTNIAGTISGSAGGTVTIKAFRSSDGLLIGSTTTTGNGAYNIIWYNDTDTIYVLAYETSTLNASTTGTAGATMDMDLATGGGGGGGPTYYAYS